VSHCPASWPRACQAGVSPAGTVGSSSWTIAPESVDIRRQQDLAVPSWRGTAFGRDDGCGPGEGAPGTRSFSGQVDVLQIDTPETGV
jgi:hypothetical protein